MIDIKNSQPLILALTLNNWTNAPKPPTGKGKPHHHPKPPTPTPYVFTLSDACLNDDRNQFLQLCVDGRIYEALAKKTGLSRDEVKKRFFAVAYGGQDDMNTRVGNAFGEMFPDCFAAIRQMKPRQAARPRNGERRIKDPAQGELARRMQRLESELVIGTVCDRLRRESPGAAS